MLRSQDQYKVLRSHIQSVSLPFLLPRQLQCLCPLLADYSVCHVHSSSNHGFDFVHLPFHSALGPRDIIVSHFSTVDDIHIFWLVNEKSLVAYDDINRYLIKSE